MKKQAKIFGYPRNRVIGFFLILIAINCFIILVSMLIFSKKGAEELTRLNATQSKKLAVQPVAATKDFKPRLFDASLQDDIFGYPDSVFDVMLASSEDELVGLWCDQYFIAEQETGILFYREDTEHHGMAQKVTNPVYEKLISFIPAQKKLLAGKLCQTQDNRYILEYTLGDEDSDYLVGENTQTYLLVTPDNSGMTQPVNEPILLTSQQSWSYVGCNTPLQLTTNNLLYYGCSVIREDGTSKTLFYEVDLSGKKTRLFEKCTYTYDGKASRTCTTDEL